MAGRWRYSLCVRFGRKSKPIRVIDSSISWNGNIHIKPFKLYIAKHHSCALVQWHDIVAAQKVLFSYLTKKSKAKTSFKPVCGERMIRIICRNNVTIHLNNYATQRSCLIYSFSLAAKSSLVDRQKSKVQVVVLSVANTLCSTSIFVCVSNALWFCIFCLVFASVLKLSFFENKSSRIPFQKRMWLTKFWFLFLSWLFKNW